MLIRTRFCRRVLRPLLHHFVDCCKTTDGGRLSVHLSDALFRICDFFGLRLRISAFATDRTHLAHVFENDDRQWWNLYRHALRMTVKPDVFGRHTSHVADFSAAVEGRIAVQNFFVRADSRNTNTVVVPRNRCAVQHHGKVF